MGFNLGVFMYSLFVQKKNNVKESIIKLISTVRLLDSKAVNALLANQEQHATAIYEVLTLLKEKGQQNRTADWVEETFHYSQSADVFTLLSSENIMTSLHNAKLLESSILPALREKDVFSQEDFNVIVRRAIARDNVDNHEEAIFSSLEKNSEITCLLKKQESTPSQL